MSSANNILLLFFNDQENDSINLSKLVQQVIENIYASDGETYICHNIFSSNF